MSKEITIWIVIGVYLAFMLSIGLLNKKSSSSMTSFTVGNRSAGGWISALSYGTAYFSAVMFIGYAGKTGWGFGGGYFIGSFGHVFFSELPDGGVDYIVPHMLNKAGGWAGMISGFVIALPPVIAKLFANDWEIPLSLGKVMDCGPIFAVAAMLVSFILCIVISLATGGTTEKCRKKYEFFYEDSLVD